MGYEREEDKMAKKTIYNCAYLKVEVDRPGFYSKQPGREDWRRVAEDLSTQIKRHCDGVTSVSIEHDVDEVCEFCGWPWTEKSDTHNECCAEDATQDDH